MKLLIVEDNPQLSDDLDNFLTENGFIVEVASTLQKAKEKVDLYSYDLILLDIGLPDGNGLELLNAVKDNSETGILIVTAKNALEDKIKGLELGADDYITKPFHKAELNARIRSILRRKKFAGSNILQVDEVKVNLSSLQVFVNDNPIILTKKEFDLLVYFLYNKDRVLTKESIAEHLWGDNIDQSDNFDFLYNHIKNLRKKIVNAGGKSYIQSVYGMGYKFSIH
ncbi:MAG: response regulator transcription factor [Bacteroidales bacterium]|nr:response regulator transcription factor [Bacteroidales bacterium]HPD95759.1 response regulator transcription factor [Tenuifilaceae bacterium]HRX32226.1 response regulator transcription factor [Tenuifilaceae bacterium]